MMRMFALSYILIGWLHIRIAEACDNDTTFEIRNHKRQQKDLERVRLTNAWSLLHGELNLNAELLAQRDPHAVLNRSDHS